MSKTNNTAPTIDPLTIAYIGYGLRAAFVSGMKYDADHFEGESGLMAILTGHASTLDAEWQRRYGVDGIEPDGCDFVFYYEIAEPFGELFSKQLAADRNADPKPLIDALFRQADPDFTEPDPEPGYDMPAIRTQIRNHVIDRLTNKPEAAGEFIDNGFAGLARRSDEELIELYEHIFGKQPPRIDPASNADHERLAA